MVMFGIDRDGFKAAKIPVEELQTPKNKCLLDKYILYTVRVRATRVAV